MEREYKRSRRYRKKDDRTDKIFMRTIRRSMISMILCTVCLVSSTWAWFVASAESQVSVIRLGEATLTVKREGSAGEKTIRQSMDGEFRLSAGEYIISVEPLTGTAPMYCVMEISTDKTPEERAEKEFEDFLKEMEESGEEWYPVYATDSNAILLLDDEEVNEYCGQLTEQDEITYDILSFPVVHDGKYRVDWAPEEDRVFLLKLTEKSYVTFEIFWMTEDEAEDIHPGLEELSGDLNMIIYQAGTATPDDAAVQTTEATETSAAAESSSAATETGAEAESSSAAIEPSTEAENSTEATEPSTEEESSTEATEPSPTEESSTEATKPSTEAENSTAESESGTDTESGNLQSDEQSSESDNTVIKVNAPKASGSAAQNENLSAGVSEISEIPSSAAGVTPDPTLATEDIVAIAN